MSELQTIKCYMNQLPATLIKILIVNPPIGFIPNLILTFIKL